MNAAADWATNSLGALAVFHYRPEGFVAGLIVFVGAYTLTHSLHGLNWVLLAGICEVLLGWLAPLIHLGTLMMVPPAPASRGVFTFLLPGIAQVYWLWELWPATGAVSHPLTLMCAAVAGAAWDQDFGADHTRRLARAAFADTPPRPDETTAETEAALISNANR